MREAERLGQSEFGAKTASLSVNKWNKAAIAMYERLGFEMEDGRLGGSLQTLMDPLRLVQFRMEKRIGVLDADR
jgi:ribosomal protein S18 acetylase RimI-like enzyme